MHQSRTEENTQLITLTNPQVNDVSEHTVIENTSYLVELSAIRTAPVSRLWSVPSSADLI